MLSACSEVGNVGPRMKYKYFIQVWDAIKWLAQINKCESNRIPHLKAHSLKAAVTVDLLLLNPRTREQIKRVGKEVVMLKVVYKLSFQHGFIHLCKD